MEPEKCPDCGGELEKGLPLDFSHYGAIIPQRFAKGAIASTSMVGFRLVKNITDLRIINAYRCIKCNRLFQYTDEAVTNYHSAQKSSLMIVLLILMFAPMIVLILGYILSVLFS